jgi:death-on-curing protein
MDVVWLDAETVTELNRVALEESETHALNPGSDLNGALNRPKGYFHYQGVRSLYELAALYAVALVEAHAFQDGNKRTALLAIRAFLRANNMDFDYGSYDEEAAELMTGIATSDVDRDELVDWIRSNTTGGT